MRALGVLLLCLGTFGSLDAFLFLDNFLNCDHEVYTGTLRRCCENVELPNSCECFDISVRSPFTNSVFHKPECPDVLQVKFWLHNQQTTSSGVLVKSGKLASSSFDPSLPTRVIAHGFTDSGDTPWMLEMKDEYLALEPCNVILVDWKEGARAPNYPQAVANTRTVGAMVARLIQDMIQDGSSFDSFHLIGHSLGAQIMGYAGQEIKRLENQKLGRITGLDPAGPLFESYSYVVRIDKKDAKFVDIIHTDAEDLLSAGFGDRNSIGHVDFWPNGGQHQPGCPPETYGIFSMLDFQAEEGGGACSHGRAVHLFTHSINNCRYNPPSGSESCTMGHHTSPSCRGDYYPETTATSPFC